MENSKFSLKNRLKSFIFAFNGLKILFKNEHNSRIHLVFAIIVIAFSFLFKISPIQWSLVIFAIAIVFAAEIFNSAIELICNRISLENENIIKKIKDLSAAAVLVCSIAAAIIGLIIFIPYIFNFINAFFK